MEKDNKNITNSFHVVKKCLESVENIKEPLVRILEKNGYTFINDAGEPITNRKAHEYVLETSFLWIFNEKESSDDFVVLIDFGDLDDSQNETYPALYTARFKNRKKSWSKNDAWGEKEFWNDQIGHFAYMCQINELNKNEVIQYITEKKVFTGSLAVLEDFFVRNNSLNLISSESSITEIILNDFNEMKKAKTGFLKS